MNEQELRRLLGDSGYEALRSKVQLLHSQGRSPDEIATEVTADLQTVLNRSVIEIIRIVSGFIVHRCPPTP